MDQRLTQALEFANYRLTLQAQRQNILARVEAALLVSYQNTIFKSTPELISFVGVHSVASKDRPLYVDDQNGNTHKIENKSEFLQSLLEAYDNAYALKHQEQQKLKSARNTAKIVGL